MADDDEEVESNWAGPEVSPFGLKDRNGPDSDHSTIYLSKHPLSDFSLEDRQSFAREMGAPAEREFSEAMAVITNHFDTHDLGVTLAALASKHLGRPVGPDGILEYGKGTVVLPQSKIELAQAIALSRTSSGTEAATSADLHRLTAALDTITDLFQRRDLRFVGTGSVLEQQRRIIQARLRGHTTVVRNWGYFNHVYDLLNRLLDPLDTQMRSAVGLTGRQLLAMFRLLIEAVQLRTVQLLVEPARWCRLPCNEDIYASYAEGMGYSESERGKEWAEIESRRLSREMLQAYVQDRFLARLPAAYAFSIPSLAEYLEVEELQVRRAVNTLALPIRGLDGADPEGFFLANPIWSKPLIKIDEDNFFAFAPAAFFSHSFQILNDLLGADHKRSEAYSRQRADFLEKEVAGLFFDVFKGAPIDTNVTWSTDAEEGETDLIVRVDSQLLLVEVKAGKVSAAALRGGLKRAEKHIDELLLEPARQSARLAEHLLTKPENRHPGWRINTDLDLRGITRVTRLSVTLEDFATIQSHLPSLLEQIGIEDTVALPATLSVSDLHTVFEILEEPWQCLHYLVRRGELQNRVRYLGDELDLLGLYLRTGFALMQFSEGGAQLTLQGMSDDIDTYVTNRDAGVELPKPRRRFTPWFAAMTKRLSNIGLAGKSEMLLTIGSFSLETQIEFEQAISELREKMRADTGHENDCIYGVPKGWDREGVAIHLSRTTNRQQQMEREIVAASHLFENTDAKRCLVITQDLDGIDYPYTRCGLALSPDIEAEEPWTEAIRL